MTEHIQDRWASMPTGDHGERRPAGPLGSGAAKRTSISAQPPRSFDTAELFGGDTEIEITHQQTVYRLKITRQGKLILNK